MPIYNVLKDPPINGALCSICNEPIVQEPSCVVQEVEDDEGNLVVDAPYIYYHKACLGESNN